MDAVPSRYLFAGPGGHPLQGVTTILVIRSEQPPSTTEVATVFAPDATIADVRDRFGMGEYKLLAYRDVELIDSRRLEITPQYSGIKGRIIFPKDLPPPSALARARNRISSLKSELNLLHAQLERVEAKLTEMAWLETSTRWSEEELTRYEQQWELLQHVSSAVRTEIEKRLPQRSQSSPRNQQAQTRRGRV